MVKLTSNLTTKELILVFISLVVVIFSAGIIGYNIGTGRISFDAQSNRLLNKKDLQTAFYTITSNFNGTINEDAILNEGIKGMVFGLQDKNSFYLYLNEYNQITKAHADPDLIYKKLNKTYGYLKISQFAPSLEKKFTNILKTINKDDPKKLIIDLRDNPGGDGDSEIFLANQFLHSEIISQEEYKDQSLNSIYSAKGNPSLPDISLIILINSNTASAAEIFTAAIQDNKRGIVVGEKSYGKGTIGRYYELPNGAAIHLTVGKWLTPNDQWIHKKGITPDYLIKDDLSTTTDEILQKAETL